MPVIVATLYRFADLPDFAAKRAPLLALGREWGVKGTLLLAREGINGTIAGSREGIDALLGWLRQDPRLAAVQAKESMAPALPFQRFKVRLKREIVTLGLSGLDPSRQTGIAVPPREWNAVMMDPETITIDTRNRFEVAIGRFAGAIDPQTRTFRDFPAFVRRHLDPQRHRAIAMYCTGGIRCEKASAYLLQQGFEQVYQLQGGILNYLEQVSLADSQWQGECFVFDERVAVGHGLTPGSYEMCLACGHPIHPTDQRSPHYVPGIACPHCYADLTPEKRDRQRARQQTRQAHPPSPPA